MMELSGLACAPAPGPEDGPNWADAARDINNSPPTAQAKLKAKRGLNI